MYLNDKKSNEIFRNLIQSQNFWDSLKREREAISKLNGGLASIETSRQFKNDKSFKRFIKASKNLLKEFGLNQHFSSIIEDYLIYGKKFEQKFANREFSVYGAYLYLNFKHLNPGKAVVEIYPGATLKSVQNLIAEWWGSIDKNFREKFPEEYKYRVKTKPNRERDLKIYNLYKSKVIQSNGKANIRTMRELYGIEFATSTSNNDLRKIISDNEGIKLPNSIDTIRNIIQRMKEKSR